MTLLLDKETYEQFGMEGQKHGSRWEVRAAATERLAWCVRRLPPVRLRLTAALSAPSLRPHHTQLTLQ